MRDVDLRQRRDALLYRRDYANRYKVSWGFKAYQLLIVRSRKKIGVIRTAK
jgi:hypothetical protein